MNFIESIIISGGAFLYIPAFLGMFVDGNITLIFFGALSHSHKIHLSIIFFLTTFGELIHDIGFWIIGKKIKETNREKFLGIKTSKLSDFLKNNGKRLNVYLFISKFMLGTNRIALLSSGYSEMKFKRFIKISISSILIWVPSLLLLGHIFARKTRLLEKEVWIIGISLLFIFLFVSLIEYILRIALKNCFNCSDK